jgi:hypothetical protein
MGRELAIKLYLTYPTVRYDCTIRPKVVGTDDCGVPAPPRSATVRPGDNRPVD